MAERDKSLDELVQIAEDINHAKTILGKRIEELTNQIRAATNQASADFNNAKAAFLPAIAELVGELLRTRIAIEKGSATATEGTNALVRWTKALVLVTIVYALFTGGLLGVAVWQMAAQRVPIAAAPAAAGPAGAPSAQAP